MMNEGYSTGYMRCMMVVAVVATLLTIAICMGLLLMTPLERYVLPDRFTQVERGSPVSGTSASPRPSVPTPSPAIPTPTLQPPVLGKHAITRQTADQVIEIRTLGATVLGPVAFAPDGRTLAIANSHIITLYDREDRVERRKLEGSTGRIMALAWSPSGSLLASASNNVISLWDAPTGRILRTMRGEAAVLTVLAFAPDGRLLASGGGATAIQIWETTSGQLLQTITQDDGGLVDVAFAPDGKTLASATEDGSVRLWDLPTASQREEFVFRAPTDQQTDLPIQNTSLAYAPNGKQLAVGNTKGIVYLIDSKSGTIQHQLEGHTTAIIAHGAQFTTDGNLLITSAQNGEIALWDPTIGRQIDTLEGHFLSATSLSISRDGQHVASSSGQEGRLLIWDLQRRQAPFSLQIGQGVIMSLAFSPDNTTLGTVGYNGTVYLHNLVQERISVFAGALAMPQALAFLPDGRLAVLSDQRSISLIDAGQVQALDGLAGKPVSVCTSSSGLIAAGSSSGTIALWETSSGALKQTFESAGAIGALAFNSSGSLLAGASVSNNSRVRIWDTTAGELSKMFSGPGGRITRLAFQPYHDVVAAASVDGSLWLWDISRGSVIRTLSATSQQRWFTSLAFSPDGTLLATSATNGDVQFWNAQTGRSIGTPINIGRLDTLALDFSPDGQLVAVSFEDGAVRLFGLPDSK